MWLGLESRREVQAAVVTTDGQLERSRKLAYVSFSRAEKDVRIILFTPEPDAAKAELIGRYTIKPDQIVIDR